jgi:hypothetical protein
MEFKRMQSTQIIAIISKLSDYEKTKAWAELSRRTHGKDCITGAISNNGPKERRK